MREIWKDILGYNGYYKISNLGRVKSLERKAYHYIAKDRKVKEKIRKISIRKKDKYCDVMLFKDGNYKHCLIHRLVALAFIPNPKKKLEVNHKDLNRQNNNVNNLEWATREENEKHYYNLIKNKI